MRINIGDGVTITVEIEALQKLKSFIQEDAEVIAECAEGTPEEIKQQYEEAKRPDFRFHLNVINEALSPPYPEDVFGDMKRAVYGEHLENSKLPVG